jgi:uncharacterized membrane protein (UPF0127 family)
MARNEDQNTKNSTRRVSTGTKVLALLLVVALVSGAWYMFSNRSSGARTGAEASAVRAFTKQGELSFNSSGGKARTTIDIEIADDDYRREIGLMDRRSMGEREGMLFIFPDERPVGFWMKDTYIPLDIIFVNSRREIVTIHKNAKPFSEETYPSTAPAQFVVEVNGGFTEKYGIVAGNRIDWTRK